MESGAVPFSETQQWKPRWRYFLLLVLIPPAFASWRLAAGEPFDRSLLVSSAVVALGCLAFAVLAIPQILFLSRVQMRTSVDRAGISLTTITGPRWIPLGHIRSARVTRYRPIRDYGGWGTRHSRHGQALTSYGNQGVLLKLHDGARVLIGSQRPSALLSALAQLGVGIEAQGGDPDWDKRPAR